MPGNPLPDQLNQAPLDAAADVAQAVALVSQATGLRFVDDGATTVIPSTTYGRGPNLSGAPVIIAWATAEETDGLGQTSPTYSEVGRTESTPLVNLVTGQRVTVSGSIVIDAHRSQFLSPGFGPFSVGIVLMHELGHLVGLDHVDNPDDIMNPTLTPTQAGAWGAGDLAGLNRLGASSGCLAVAN